MDHASCWTLCKTKILFFELNTDFMVTYLLMYVTKTQFILYFPKAIFVKWWKNCSFFTSFKESIYSWEINKTNTGPIVLLELPLSSSPRFQFVPMYLRSTENKTIHVLLSFSSASHEIEMKTRMNEQQCK